MLILERQFQIECPVSAAVAWWNYWDWEHMPVVHRKSYASVQVLIEDEGLSVSLLKVRPPLFPALSFDVLVTMVQRDADTLQDVWMGPFGVSMTATMHVEEIRPDYCRFQTTYRALLYGWRVALAPLIGRLFARWNERVWDEDLPMKLRRQKVLRMGFQDFHGLPASRDDRHYEGELLTRIPVARPSNSPVNTKRTRQVPADRERMGA